MATEIIIKRCSKCKQFKSLSEFHKNRNKKDGLHNCCKTCQRVYVSNYRKTEKGKANQKRHQQNYQQSEKGKEVHRKAVKKFQSRHPNYLKAIRIVNTAVTAGKLPRPNTLQCHCCPAQAKQYHHWRGYEKEHWLDVLPTCVKCHIIIHKKIA